jgi:hypothetical protein
MDNVKKMVLVDPKMLSQLQQNRNPIPDAATENLKTLDRDMNQIINHKNEEDQHEQASQYAQLLMRYLARLDQVKKRPLGVVTVKTQSTTNPAMESDIVQGVPKTYERKARAILQRLKEDQDVSWNEKGEFVYKGEPVLGSNMTDLVNDVLRSRTTVPTPTGWETFARALKANNTPRELIGHSQRWKWMQGETEPPPPPLPPQPTSPTKPRKKRRGRDTTPSRWTKYKP